MKTFKKTQTMLDRVDPVSIRNHIVFLDGQIKAYKDMLYHLQNKETTDALAKCEQNLEVIRHNKELLRVAMGWPSLIKKPA